MGSVGSSVCGPVVGLRYLRACDALIISPLFLLITSCGHWICGVEKKKGRGRESDSNFQAIVTVEALK